MAAPEIFAREVVEVWKSTHGQKYSIEIDGRKFWTMLEFQSAFSSPKGTWYLLRVPWIESTNVWFRMKVGDGSELEARHGSKNVLIAGCFVWNSDNKTISLEKRYDTSDEASRVEFLRHVRDKNPAWILDFSV